MSEITKELVMERVQHWQGRLGLSEWALTVELAPCGGAAADCEAEPEYLKAHVRFDPEVVVLRHLDAYVTHELMHCHVWRLAHLAQTLAGEHAGVMEWIRLEEESLVCRLERIALALGGAA